MNVKELIAKLVDCPMDAPVLVTVPECETVEVETNGWVEDVRRLGTGGNEVVIIKVGF